MILDGELASQIPNEKKKRFSGTWKLFPRVEHFNGELASQIPNEMNSDGELASQIPNEKKDFLGLGNFFQGSNISMGSWPLRFPMRSILMGSWPLRFPMRKPLIFWDLETFSKGQNFQWGVGLSDSQ